MEKNSVIINTFIKGVNTDIAEDHLPDEFLSGGHNIKFSNDIDKQGIVQKQEGYIKKLNGYRDHLKPLVAKGFQNVLYIVSYDTLNDVVEYGSYPSADINNRYHDSDTNTERAPKVPVYAPLPNYRLLDAIQASPITHYNISSSGDSLISNIVSNNNTNWTVTSHSSNVTPTPMSGSSGDAITMTLPANTGAARQETVTVATTSGSSSTQITLQQLRMPLDVQYEFNNTTHTSITYDGTEETVVMWKIVDLSVIRGIRTGANISVNFAKLKPTELLGTPHETIEYCVNTSTTPSSSWTSLAGVNEINSVTLADNENLFIKIQQVVDTDEAITSGVSLFSGTILPPVEGSVIVGENDTWTNQYYVIP